MRFNFYTGLLFSLLYINCLADDSSFLKQKIDEWITPPATSNDYANAKALPGTKGANGNYRYGSPTPKAAEKPVAVSIINQILGNTQPCVQNPLAMQYAAMFFPAQYYDANGNIVDDFQHGAITYSGGCGNGAVTVQAWIPDPGTSVTNCSGGTFANGPVGNLLLFNFNSNASGVGCQVAIQKAAASGYAQQTVTSPSWTLWAGYFCTNLYPQCPQGMILMNSNDNNFPACNISVQLNDTYTSYIQYSDGDIDQNGQTPIVDSNGNTVLDQNGSPTYNYGPAFKNNSNVVDLYGQNIYLDSNNNPISGPLASKQSSQVSWYQSGVWQACTKP